ncbi:toll/interleukin-1 receptor domain-containing protein [Methylocella sp. CPCC 101449]|uniref:toll/interleukin-1 receptor domain-containing protein n=1 Tax=Methylocella sp. CPCC 101449 TaxID=2987531 RepID=UPI003908AEB9
MRAGSVFISYSWDSAHHKRWVKNLALKLMEAGVDVIVDQLHLQPGESLTQFMERSLNRCRKVLVICTPNYARRSNRRRGGVGYEQQIITAQIAQGLRRNKFIPILKSGQFDGHNCSIPIHLSGISTLDMRSSYSRRNAFQRLLENLHPTISVAISDHSSRARHVRLPNIELDGWQLRSGVASHHRNPRSFWIPSEAQRRHIPIGTFVKLIFSIKIRSQKEDFGERMWVRLQRRDGPYYIGTLANHPFSYGDQRKLAYGTSVVFLPEHIISIANPPQN